MTTYYAKQVRGGYEFELVQTEAEYVFARQARAIEDNVEAARRLRLIRQEFVVGAILSRHESGSSHGCAWSEVSRVTKTTREGVIAEVTRQPELRILLADRMRRSLVQRPRWPGR